MSYDLPSYEGWDCPTCMRPMEKEDEHECSTCGLNASEHISVTAMCRILREVSGREAALTVKLAAERALADRLAEAFKDLWDNHTMYGAGYEVVEKAIAAWKEARSE